MRGCNTETLAAAIISVLRAHTAQKYEFTQGLLRDLSCVVLHEWSVRESIPFAAACLNSPNAGLNGHWPTAADSLLYDLSVRQTVVFGGHHFRSTIESKLANTSLCFCESSANDQFRYGSLNLNTILFFQWYGINSTASKAALLPEESYPEISSSMMGSSFEMVLKAVIIFTRYWTSIEKNPTGPFWVLSSK